MKNIKSITIATVLFLYFIIIPTHCQTISYILPDIGSPGMNIYMEIIGPTANLNNFGNDGLIVDPYHDNNLRVELENPADSNKIVFGQMIISWQGRMVATQVFVNPFMNIPNSSKWNELNPEFIVRFRLIVNGTATGYVNYYIVNTSEFGDLTSNSETVFGQGNLGIRSPRGAMIVDSLHLGARVYTTSTNDCDPNIDGNQGYLPFVLLAKKNIIGVAGTKISVDGATANAGPGGGGGGGNFCDGSILNPISGSDGGNGFVGGGPGGRNGSLVSNEFKSWGQGTGTASSSLNSVDRPITGWYEASGGATGHPFGTSGKGVYVSTPPTEANNAGGYGGGTGENQNSKGGGGGYATQGQGSDAFNAGKVNGNEFVVPIAGGSGGASGNPNATHECSGKGGGGGGAIEVFAQKLSNCSISANGGNGDDGNSNSDGGGGSGGYVGVFMKVRSELITASVTGGVTGGTALLNGAGRVRFDIYTEGLGTSSSTANASLYRGITTDTTNIVNRVFNLKGTKPSNIQIGLYLKSQTSNWTLIGTDNSASTNWTLPINLIGSDSVYYLNVVQYVSSPGSSRYCSIQTKPYFVTSCCKYFYLG